MRQMKVDKLGIDLLTHDPVVILKDMDGSHYLPILIGPFGATAIALALEGAPVPRPLSHDLMSNILDSLSAKLEQVVIHDINSIPLPSSSTVSFNGNAFSITNTDTTVAANAVNGISDGVGASGVFGENASAWSSGW